MQNVMHKMELNIYLSISSFYFIQIKLLHLHHDLLPIFWWCSSNNCLQTGDSINYWHLMSLLFTTVMHISFYFHIQLKIEEVKKSLRWFFFHIWFHFRHASVATAACMLPFLMHVVLFVTIARDQQVKQKFSYSLFSADAVTEAVDEKKFKESF